MSSPALVSYVVLGFFTYTAIFLLAVLFDDGHLSWHLCHKNLLQSLSPFKVYFAIELALTEHCTVLILILRNWHAQFSFRHSATINSKLAQIELNCRPPYFRFQAVFSCVKNASTQLDSSFRNTAGVLLHYSANLNCNYTPMNNAYEVHVGDPKLLDNFAKNTFFWSVI